MRKNKLLVGVLTAAMVMGNITFPTAIITAEEETVTHYGGSVTMDGSSYMPLNYEFTLEELIGDNDVDDIKYIVFEGDTDFNIAFNTIYYDEESGYDDEGTYWRYYTELDSYIVDASVLCWDTNTSNNPYFYFQITNWKADGEDHVYTWEVILKSDADADDITGNIVGKAEQSIYAYLESELKYIGRTTQIVVGLEEDEITFSKNYNIGDASYSSSDESILTVTDDGLVTAVGVGSADVTVTVSGDNTYASASKTFSFTIDKQEQGIEAYFEEKTIYVGETAQIIFEDNSGAVYFEEYLYNVGDISCSSSDESVATVSDDGLVTGVGEGTAEITVTASGDYSTYPASDVLTITVEKVGGQCGTNLTWEITIDHVLIISGTGSMYDSYTPWDYDVSLAYNKLVIEEGVTSIGDYAFYDNSALTSVVLPDSLTSIGNYAFCRCSRLTSIKIPENVTSIGDYAFQLCTGLTSIDVSDTVTSIGQGVFSGCDGLADENGLVIVNNILYDCCEDCASVDIPEGVTTIGYNALSDCKSLTTITIPDSVVSIENNALSSCDALTDVYYTGTKTQWDEIEIGSYNSNLTNATLHCELVSGTCGDNLTWVLNTDGTLTISGIGNMDDYYYWTSPWDDYSSNITTIKIENGVTSIGDYAFSYCSWLTSVEISDSVTSIGEYAFGGCNMELTSIDIPDSVTYIGPFAFGGCNNLTDVSIPDGLTSIENYTFYNCTSLTHIDIPASVNFIGYMVFEGCSSLAEINVDADNEIYASVDGILYNKEMTTLIRCPGAKTGSVVIPDGVIDIEDYAFSGCSGLTSIEISDSVTNIGDYVFKGCSGLTEMELPEGVESIGARPFYECYGLADEEGFVIVNDVLYEYFGESTDVVVPDGVVLIDSGTFIFSDITSVEIPSSVSLVEGYTFYNCNKLTNVVLPDSITSIGDSAFNSCYSLTSIEIPDSVTSIGEGAFGYCTNLTSIEIPSSVTSIGSLAFCTCMKLEEVKLNEGLESIGSFAFSSCSALTEVTIPASVTSIGKYAFGCYWYITSDGEYCGPYTLVTVYGYENTAAEAYVEDYGMCESSESGELEEVAVFVPITITADTELGDANGDDTIDYLDAMTVLRYDAELIELTSTQLRAADVNSDGTVDSLDAILILRYDADLIESF